MKEPFNDAFKSPLSKKKDDRKYIEYLENSIEKVLGLGNYRPLIGSKHMKFKRRTKVYERI